MKLFSKHKKVTLVVAPFDMRMGYRRLAVKAEADLGIRMDFHKDMVVFLSRSRKICKIIDSDPFGTTLLTRRLSAGGFQQLMAKIDGNPVEELTVEELERFLEGKDIRVKRTSVTYG